MQLIKEMKWIFSDNDKLKAAFHAIKVDMELMDENHDSLKKSTNDWIIFLDAENRALKSQVLELENRLEMLESISAKTAEQKLEVIRSV